MEGGREEKGSSGGGSGYTITSAALSLPRSVGRTEGRTEGRSRAAEKKKGTTPDVLFPSPTWLGGREKKRAACLGTRTSKGSPAAYNLFLPERAQQQKSSFFLLSLHV